MQFAIERGSIRGFLMLGEGDRGVVSAADVVPTQVTVGLREIDFKRRQWREKSSHEAACYLRGHTVPLVLGPGARHYLIDRHHLVRALHAEGVDRIPARLVADMSSLGIGAFWSTLERRRWAHPFDEDGRRRQYACMPKTILDLADDPFRSLAGALKRAGGYAKDGAPFSEFRWADFLRGRVPKALIESDFERALSRALEWSGSREAALLPGWRGCPDLTGGLHPSASRLRGDAVPCLV